MVALTSVGVTMSVMKGKLGLSFRNCLSLMMIAIADFWDWYAR